MPRRVSSPLVTAYAAWLGIDMSEVERPADGFRTFGEFFARRLKPNARPVSSQPQAVVSPCDGLLTSRGRIGQGGGKTLTVKNRWYSVTDLVGDEALGAELVGGQFCLFYLHPRDYHRVHVPMDAVITAIRHLPGARYPAAPWAARLAAGVPIDNERVVFDLELPRSHQRCGLVMIAAFGVGNIECLNQPRGPASRGRQPFVERRPVNRGEEIGAFRLGSTVGLLWPEHAISLDERLEVGTRVFAGQAIGRLAPRANPPSACVSGDGSRA
jgi:phosphatidylserine decarboxylase